jgi:CheY-like chemotaxis protein
MAEPLKGLRVLVVEDEYLIASWIEDILNAAGCVVAEPITHLAEAQEAARENAYDAAVLDIDLRGERVYPVAEILSEREIPYFFVSAYQASDLPAGYEGRPKLGKPFRSEQLLQTLSSLVSAPVNYSAGFPMDGRCSRSSLLGAGAVGRRCREAGPVPGRRRFSRTGI